MTTKAQKTPMNVALKVAIVESRKTSRRVAHLARIGEVRLSAIVNGRIEPSEDERRILAKVLKRQPSELFPESQAVAS